MILEVTGHVIFPSIAKFCIESEMFLGIKYRKLFYLCAVYNEEN